MNMDDTVMPGHHTEAGCEGEINHPTLVPAHVGQGEDVDVPLVGADQAEFRDHVAAEPALDADPEVALPDPTRVETGAAAGVRRGGVHQLGADVLRANGPFCGR